MVPGKQSKEVSMAMRLRQAVTVVLVLALALGGGIAPVAAQAPGPPDESAADGRTPPRLGYVDGQVSFWRPGATDWVAAQINTPLAPGDELFTGSPGNLELQIGARAFVRAWADTSLGLVNQDPDYLQIKLTAGHVALDLRTLDPGRIVELDTPNAAFTIDHAGYYRVDVGANRTSFISRRGGRAIVTPANGQAAAIASSEEVIVESVDMPQVAAYVAPPLDEWDRWNYARTEYLVDAVSARYVSPGAYGVSDLDRHGRWRVVSDYGAVWVPTAVPAGWVPYSTGTWTWDPYFGWTWVDSAPWGWAPFHYGRWVFVDGFWAWTPGPVVRPVYAPALVAFFGGGPAVAVRAGGPVIGWVALGWGEPVVPWWGGPRFVGAPWWGGWGGPRVVNNVVINRTTIINVQNITTYRNATAPNAVVAVEHQRFGQGLITRQHVARVDIHALEPVRGRLDVKPSPGSLVPSSVRGVRPPEQHLARPVVATRVPQPAALGPTPETVKPTPVTRVAPTPRLVPAPQEPNAAVAAPRPPFGRGQAERPQPSPPPIFKGGPPRTPQVVAPPPRPSGPPAARESNALETPGRTSPASVPAPRPSPRAASPTPEVATPRPAPAPPMSPVKPPVVGEPRPASPAPPAMRQAPPQRVEPSRAPARALPGEAANRLAPGRGDVAPGSQVPRNGAPAR